MILWVCLLILLPNHSLFDDLVFIPNPYFNQLLLGYSAFTMWYPSEKIVCFLFSLYFFLIIKHFLKLCVLTITVVILLEPQISPYLSVGTPLSYFLCPFEMPVSIFVHFLIFQHNKTFQAHYACSFPYTWDRWFL